MMEYKEISIIQINDLAKMYVDTFNSEPWNDNWTIETAKKRLCQMINVEDFYGIVAYKQGELCGMILGSKEQYCEGVRFNIKEFCVRNKVRGNGIGTKVFKEFKSRLKSSGVKEIILLTSRGASTEGFYHKHGLESYKDLVFMGKQL